jgi:anti-sigma regulatory factor (Ser/Thr protein kinase)
VWHNQAIPYVADFSLNGSLNELERLAAEVSRFCLENGLDADADFQLNLVLEELFVNTVRHGGCEGVDDSTRVRLLAAADGVEVEFADRGRPFDPTAAEPANLDVPLEERRVGGLGIHLVRQIMSDLRYERCGEWNRMSMKRPASHNGAQRPDEPGMS